MMTEEAIAYYPSEIGLLEVSGTNEGIASITFVDARDVPKETPRYRGPYSLPLDLPGPLQEGLVQLHEYFEGKRKDFHSLRLLLRSTDFQSDVFDVLFSVRFGETVSYKDIASSLGNTNSARAVGSAVSRNPFAIIIPCHRVVPAGKGIGEYAWGAWRKAWLLKHENPKS